MIEAHSLVAGKPVSASQQLEVRNPFTGEIVGTVAMATAEDVDIAIDTTQEQGTPLSRHDRWQILEKARCTLEANRDSFARLMTMESGLCIRETRYEVGRAADVLKWSAIAALRDDGEMFAGDVSENGKSRRIFTLREPLSCAVAITPFNHPLNQVAHKVCPAIAAGTPIILKPSEKTPLTALRFAKLLYEAGLPASMLSVLLGPTDNVASRLVKDPRVQLVSFTGSVPVGKVIAGSAGYKRVVLELGGNDPLIIFPDADLDLAVQLAAEGSFRNSGQRCTAVKRIFVHESLSEEFTSRLVAKAKDYLCGDPMDERNRVGTVIDEPAAIYLETVINEAVESGAKLLVGGRRTGALLEPTVLSHVPKTSRLVMCESFGPIAPIMAFHSIEEVIRLANATEYGLSAGVVTNSLDIALKTIKELKSGCVNINEVPGYRVESSPFGGIKNSGLGIKEGVSEAIKLFSSIKTFSLPW
ncbi:MAG TPA: aldehyde dehydrogenase family protein [Candidatus Kapabacteria bacterium]|nr:aldehyde dehydrogenase family protein [Candidatus Kapabacteria bacterium]